LIRSPRLSRCIGSFPHCFPARPPSGRLAAAALAEAGATAHEIAAVTGHMSLEEIERYTRAARKRKLADTAMAKLK
jgi:hypothetical protein